MKVQNEYAQSIKLYEYNMATQNITQISIDITFIRCSFIIWIRNYGAAMIRAEVVYYFL